LTRLRPRARHHHAFPGREPVGLHDQRVPGLARIEPRARFGRVGVDRKRRGRDAVTRHELLGEDLARFQAGGGAARAEHRDAERGEIVGQTRRERRLRADHDQIDLLPKRELRERPAVAGRDRYDAGVALDAGVAGRADHLAHARALAQLPDQRVLSTPGSDDEYAHLTSALETVREDAPARKPPGAWPPRYFSRPSVQHSAILA